MYINRSAREIAVSVVLHGAPGSGRSTTRERLARQLPPIRGRLDYFEPNPPLRFPTGREVRGYSVVAYIERDVVLAAQMDVVVIVFDLSAARRDANLAALAELRAWPEVPWVLQLNKCDLADRMSREEAVALADPDSTARATIETSARDGIGIDRLIPSALAALR